MKNLFVRFVKNESGATAIEYGLIAAGISVAIIAVVQGLGTSLNTTFTTIKDKLDASNGIIAGPKAMHKRPRSACRGLFVSALAGTGYVYARSTGAALMPLRLWGGGIYPKRDPRVIAFKVMPSYAECV